MIASVEGEVVGLGENYVVVRVGGVGLQIFVTAPVRARMHMMEKIFLFTQLIVREDLLALYGFETEQEREFFNLLLGVNGVGPRLALSILSTLSVDAIRRAVFNEQSEVFSRVPGVGKRTAQKILLHLQDRVSAGGELEIAGSSLAGIDENVLEALTALGYSVVEAQTAIQNIPRDAPDDLEERLRLALRYFSG
ncbi:MAG: Holliday junction branch migration protein RuvA [Chloroflexi bacterium]|nr:Holliday junction branch migration protein RuvA [Chloroflexota bacterium]